MLLFAGVARAQTTDVARGIEALARRDVNGADAAFTRGTTSANALIRPAAWQWRAHVAWKLRGDTAAAVRYLTRGLVEARDSSQILLEIARLTGARRRYREAARTAYDAMRRSADAERRGLAARTLVGLAADGAFAARRNRISDSVDVRILTEARDTMAGRVARFHGRTTDALALIDAAAILRDTIGLRAGLRSYFALVDNDIRKGVDSLVERPLTAALLDGRLFEPLALYLRAGEVDLLSAELADAMGYADFIHGLRIAIAGVYRRELSGVARPGDVSRALNAQGRRLWRVLRWNGAAPEFYPAGLHREMSLRFGTVLTIERTRGVDELFLAHRLDSYAVKAGTVVVLDGAVASGIDQWLLDAAGGRAGWVSRDTIYERRTGFTETPFRAWLALTDPQTMPGEAFRIMRDSIGDIERARRDSLGYFPGVAARMFRDGADSLLAFFRRLDDVNSEKALPRVFALGLYQGLIRSSILLHESRHVADARSGRASPQVEDEFRAKLDEVTEAHQPRLALTAILSPNIGDSSPHGQANRRIMRGLARWIRRNGNSIRGYDPAMPALLQLPMLTDDQLRAAFRSMRLA